MKALFIAFFVGICCFLSGCNVRTSSNQEPIIINWDTELVELPVDNIENNKKAVTFTLDYAEAYKNLGASYLKLGKLDEAIVELTRAIQINPSFVEAHYLLADVYSIKGEGVLSRASLGRAMALEGSYIIDVRSYPRELLQAPITIGVPRRWKPLPK